MPVRVLLVTNEYPPDKTAGTAMATRFLAEELESRGHRVTVVVNTRRAAPPHEISGTLEVVRLRPLSLPATRMVQRAALLTRVARRVRPEIIQGQSLSCGALAALVGGLLGIPSTVYVQGLDLYESGAWAQRTYIRWALRRNDAVVAVTHDLRQRAYGLSGRQAEVIPHGLRMREAHALDRREARTLLGLPVDAPLVLFVGRLITIKGVDHLIRAMRNMAETQPSARLIVVGDGQERALLQALAQGAGLADRVTFAGERPHEDVIRFMRAADVFVLPSLVESFGIVLLEAMSCGLPVVASNVMGIPSIVADGVNGFLVPPADDRAIAAGVERLLGDPMLRANFAARNVRDAAGYAMPRIADRFLELWENTVARRRQGRAAPRGAA